MQEAYPTGLLSRAPMATILPVSKSRYQEGLDRVQRLSIGEDGNSLVKSGNTGRGSLGLEWWSADGQVVFHGEMLAEEGRRYWKEGKASPNWSSHF